MDTDIPERQPRRLRPMLTLSAILVAILASVLGAGSVARAAPSVTAVIHTVSAAPPCVDPQKPLSTRYNTATKNDPVFNADFRHCFTSVLGVQMHYVIGGHGPQTMVLLHGWPESWYEFHGIMPGLLPGRTVIAIDLPGLGDSTGQPTSYRKAVLAKYIHLLLDKIGYRKHVEFVAHDFGVGVTYALAAQYRQQASGLFLMDFPLVGKALSFAQVEPLDWQFSFNLQDPLAEELVTGRVSEFLSYFYPTQSYVPRPVPAQDIAEFVRVYSRPQVLHAGFELYRTWGQDTIDNKRLEIKPLTIPVRLLTRSGLVGLLLPPVKAAAPDATGTDIPGAGHWLVEERPKQVLADIDAFFPTH
jgi:pimeloyl-ACP methyl ester carboxylesterase